MKYQMPDGNSYDFSSDEEATDALEAWNKQFNSTSLIEDLKIGVAEPLKTLSRAGAGFGSLVLPESGDDYLYGSSKIAQEGLDAWANPEKKEQSFGGKAASVLNPVGMAGAIATLPFSPFSTTQQAIDAGESAPRAAAMGLTDAIGNVVGIAAPPFKGAGIAAKMASGAAINAGQDVLSRQAISGMAETKEGQELFKPTVESAALAAIPGAGIGGIHGVVTNRREKLITEAQEIINEINKVAETQGPIAKELTTKAIRSADEQALSSERNLYNIMRTFDKLQESDPIKAQDFLQTILPRVREELTILRTDLASIDKLAVKQPDHGYEFRSKGEVAAAKVIEKFKLSDEEPIVRGVKVEEPKQEFNWDAENPKDDTEIAFTERKIQAHERAIDNLEYELEQLTVQRVQDQISAASSINSEAAADIRLGSKQFGVESRVRELEQIIEQRKSALNIDKQTLAKLNIYNDIPTTKLPEDIIFKDIPDEYKPVIERALKALGLDSELVAFYKKDTRGSQVTYNEDGSYSIGVSESTLPKGILAKFPDLNEAQIRKLSVAWSIAHELGHIVLVKSIQTDIFNGRALSVALEYKKWFDKNKSSAEKMGTAIAVRDFPSQKEYYTHFTEFFAQRVAEQLVNPTKQNIASGFVANIKSMWKELVKNFELPANSFRAVDDLIKDLVEANRKTVEDTGNTLWEMAAIKRTYNQVMSINGEYGVTRTNVSGDVPKTAEEILARTLQGTKESLPINAITARYITGSLNKAANKTIDLFMGLQQKRQLFEGNEAVTHAIDVIQKAINTQVAQVNRLLLGEPSRTVDGKRIWSLARSERADSSKVLLNKATDEDVYAVMKAFQEGFDKWTYAETLKNIGHTLSPDQVKLFTSLARMFTHLAGLSGGYILKHRKGWFPVVRNGNYTVVLHLPDSHRVRKFEDGQPVLTDAAYVQHFFSKREAEQFQMWFDKLPKEERGDLFTRGVEERVVQTENMNARQALEDELQRAIDNAGDTSAQDMKSVVTDIFDKYKGERNALAGHRKLRLSIPGYEGDVLTGSVKEQGAAFRDAMFSSVDEFTTYIMKNTIHKELGVFSKSEELKSRFPITHENINYLERYSTNDNIGMGKGVGKAIDERVDYFVDRVFREGLMKQLGKEATYGDVHLTDSTIGKLNRLFYIYALIGRPSFWAAQSVQSLWSLRTVAQTGNVFDMFTAGGKGIATLAAQPKDFKEALNYVKENRHTFKPSFLNDLNTFHFMELKEGSAALHGMEILLGEKQSSAADTFSRLTSFAIMYEHYKAQGLKGEALWNKAADKTDENMVQYGRQYKAPVFQEMGLVGQMMAPLATFPQAALGNFIADVRHLAKTPLGQGKLKASLPALTTMVISMTMAGAFAAPAIAEIIVLIELINWIARNTTGSNLMPSPKEWLLSGSNDMFNSAIQHGALSASTKAITDEGLHIGSSLQWQPMVVGYLSGEKQWNETLPSLNWAVQLAGHTTTAIKSKFIENAVSDAEERQAILGMFPSGPLRAGVDAYKYDLFGRESVPDVKGDMKRPNTPTEIATGFLGTKTLKGNVLEERAWSDKKRKMETTDRRTLIIQNIGDAIDKGDNERIKANATELMTKYHMKPREIQSAIETEMFGRKVPQGMRQFVSTAGKISDRKKWEYQEYVDRYGVDPFTGEEVDE